ncbi:hypothetical protein BIW11_11356 [Tropilaelaps mercedesae]|uniref:Uncharacterized protein n=1 Tax=Tropilaelaps mercedesae TaxID=418985 RepID=A0A1V9XBE0_9ACAR|nr:hypothetical protein BIW11_11356 [Tropilaelaps mercedesae]
MGDVKQEVRETVSNMIRELNTEDRGFVEGSGVEAVLVDALIVVCAKRPATPVSFLGDYLLCISAANKQPEGHTTGAATAPASGSTGVTVGQPAATAQIAVHAPATSGGASSTLETLRAEISKIGQHQTPASSTAGAQPGTVLKSIEPTAQTKSHDPGVRAPSAVRKPEPPSNAASPPQAPENIPDQRSTMTPPTTSTLPVISMGPPALTAGPARVRMESRPTSTIYPQATAASIAIASMAAPLMAIPPTNGTPMAPPICSPVTTSGIPIGPPLAAPVMPLGTAPIALDPTASVPAGALATNSIGGQTTAVPSLPPSLPVLTENARLPLAALHRNDGIGRITNDDKGEPLPLKDPKASSMAQPDVLSDCER